ncbi:MAG: OmpP1/FadL family transporter [bacterium]
MKISSTPNPVGSGARALGIGGAFISIADDATAASWNPGALLNLTKPEMSMVGSYYSGRGKYETLSIDERIDDLSHGQWRLNYFSAVIPFILFRRNTVFSFNYQHLYEFSRDTFSVFPYHFEDPDTGAIIADIPGMTSIKTQKGVLTTLSPAFAIQIIPPLYIGVTANLWLDKPINNYWENLNIVEGEGTSLGKRIEKYAELYERYEFSGLNVFDFKCFNVNLGFLWKPGPRFSLGGVIKTPFKASLRHNFQHSFIEEYPDDPNQNNYSSYTLRENLTLNMPVSYGLGCSFRFSDTFLLALDLYRTHWKDYLISYPSGEKISPINNKARHEADIQNITQVRFGAEYLVYYQQQIFPLRAGIFYDPEPASGSVDDFYGISLGSGFLLKNSVFDIAYQYRFGERKDAESMGNQKISSNVRQHYLYSSVIFYF